MFNTACPDEMIAVDEGYISAEAASGHSFKHDDIFGNTNELIRFHNPIYEYLVLSYSEQRRTTYIRLDVSAENVFAVTVNYLQLIEGTLINVVSSGINLLLLSFTVSKIFP